MTGRIPRYRKGHPLPKGYFDPPDPYKTPEPSDINLKKLIAYAKEAGKDPDELTLEEIQPFMVTKNRKDER